MRSWTALLIHAVELKPQRNGRRVRRRYLQQQAGLIAQKGAKLVCPPNLRQAEQQVDAKRLYQEDQMKVLVVGSGGREHALAWKLQQSAHVSELFAAPGNAGIAEIAQLVDIPATAADQLAAFAQEKGIDLAVIGPEDALIAGVVDALLAAGIRAFGPTRNAARLEGSKVWAKDLMAEFGIPTAAYNIFTDLRQAQAYCTRLHYPVVLKADGLAQGKGAVICESRDEAIAVLSRMLEEKEFGEAGERVVFEEYLEGQEASLMFFTDGISLKLMPTTQDHKALLAGDRGPNTGGMGAYTPVPGFTPELEQQCLETIAFRLLKALSSRGLPYHGVITANLMLTERGPYVLEFNARFGDPECEVVLPLLQTDLVDVIEAVLANRLSSQAVSWSSAAAMCVALASKGYPADSRSGNAISGIDQHVPHTITFHAGTAQQGDATVTAGGRVLLITATGQTLAEAREIVYDRVEQIHFDGMQYRRDIGWRALDTHSPWE